MSYIEERRVFIIKKFLLGLICGMALFAATAAAASNEVRALISSIAVSYHVGGEALDTSDDRSIALNYKGQLYVPLRKFAETMGASVYYFSPANGEGARVEVYSEDDRDLTVRDKDGYVRAGYLNRSSYSYQGFDRTLTGMPEVSGTVRFDKSIPSGKELAFALIDKTGKQYSLSGRIKLKTLHNREVSLYQRMPGDLAVFKAELPLLDNLEQLELTPVVIDKRDWSFAQYPVEGCACGAGGMNGHPLAVNIDGANAGPQMKGNSAWAINLINFDDNRHVTLTKPISFKINIYREDDESQKTIRTLTTQTFEGTVHRMRGAVRTEIVWDWKDNNGKPVAPGSYWARVILPQTATGHWGDIAGGETSFTLEDSMQAVSYVSVPEQ
ncbi:flagellar hook assembly protein FlgD [Paenibacillus sp. CAU 1782]